MTDGCYYLEYPKNTPPTYGGEQPKPSTPSSPNSPPSYGQPPKYPAGGNGTTPYGPTGTGSVTKPSTPIAYTGSASAAKPVIGLMAGIAALVAFA